MKFLLGLKVGMSQIFDQEGKQIPVTVVESGPCVVLQLKTLEKDGYQALQIGFKELKKNKIKKSQKGKGFRYIREFSSKEGSGYKEGLKLEDYKVGQVLNNSIFKEGQTIAVSGVSKGKGFQGGVKRWGFHGRPRSRGMKHESRTIGSVGGSTPPRVLKGKKMPGRMGADRVTVKNLKIVKIDPENNFLLIKGAVPGRKGTILEIRAD